MSNAEVRPGRDRHSPATRILVFGGISLILAGMLLGEVFAIFISHVASAQIRREWTESMIPEIAQGDLAAVGAGYSRIEDLLERPERIRRALALCIVVGGLTQSVFVFVSYWATQQARDWALLSSAAGGALVLFGVLATLTGLRGTPLRSDFGAETSRLLSSASSQILLKTGVFLILTGMVFGFYYAWVFVTQHEPQQIALLDGALASALSHDPSGATTSITAYRALQSRIAIVTAAHSHIIEMGIMAVLLAFVRSEERRVGKECRARG